MFPWRGMSTKTIIFDLNGTLIDDLHISYGSVKEIFRVYGKPCPTFEQYREEVSADFMKFYYRYKLPITATKDDLNAIRGKFYKSHEIGARLRPGAHRTLEWLNKFFYVAIVSAEITTNLYRILIENGIQKNFDFIKPEAGANKSKALLQASEIFGCAPQDMMYVDDTVDGLESAKTVGVVPVAFANPTGYNSERRLLEVTDLDISEIGEMKELLELQRRLQVV